MRRCTVWTHNTWHEPNYPYRYKPNYSGWLLQVDPKDGWNGKCTVVDERGKMLLENMDCVQVHTPERIPLLHGAPRRGDSEISARRGPPQDTEE